MSDHAQRLLLLCPELDYGGEERRVISFANHFAERFEYVGVLGGRGPIVDQLAPAVEFIEADFTRPTSWPSLVRTVRRIRPTIIQGHKRRAIPALRMLELLGAAPHVNFNVANQWRDRAWILRLCPRNVIVLSGIIAEHYKPALKGKDVSVLRMGGGLLAAGAASHGERKGACPTLGVVGKFSVQKNQELAVRALAATRECDVRLAFAGDGPLLEHCRAVARELGVEQRCDFLGRVDRMHEFYGSIDGVLQVSVFEGFPNSLIEAASVSLPLLATDVGATREIITDNGMLIARDADETAVARAIETFTRELERFRQGATAMEPLVREDRSLERMLRDYETYYADLAPSAA